MLAYVGNQQVICQFCRFDQFAERSIKMNTTGMSFFNLDWMNRSATGVVCERCGYVHMFFNDSVSFHQS